MVDNPIFSFTHRDYEKSRREGIAKIPVLSEGNWTDLNATDPGIIMLDYVHALVDMISFYQDHQALETFLSTAKERANIFRLAKQLSYNIRSAKGARCTVTFTSDLVYSHPIKIPKHTVLRTNNNLNYITEEDAYLLANTASVDVPCMQGELYHKSYTGTDISRYSNILNAADQEIVLTSKTIDIDSIVIKDSIGNVWKRVEYIVFSDSQEKVYQVELNSDNSITIKFGNGERGFVPRSIDILDIEYIVTNAEEGRIGANAIRNIVGSIYDEEGQRIPFSVSNHQASVGGYSAQSSESIKELAPGVIKSQDRAVTLSDFENLAMNVEGVLKAKADDINTDPSDPTLLHHVVKVLIIPESEENSELIRTRVYDYLQKRMIPPTNLHVVVPTYSVMNISIAVSGLDGIPAGVIEYDITEAIKNYFNQQSSDMNTFYPADLMATVANLHNVRNVLSMTPSEPITIPKSSRFKLGVVNISIISQRR